MIGTLPLSASLPQGTRFIPMEDSSTEGRLLVIGIETPHSTIRHMARAKVRNVARIVLGTVLDCRPEAVLLISHPGQPLRLISPSQSIGLSVSHETGFSLMAINFHGAVGVDLMRLDDQFEWASDSELVAHDYLGKHVSAKIANEPAERRQKVFADKWTAFEASLKCNGLPLSEWDAVRDQSLNECRTIALKLQGNMVGTVAIFKEIP